MIGGEPGMLGAYRGIGFNRRTWQAGNAIGRAARPYVKDLISRAKSAWRRGKDKRGAKTQTRRLARSRPFIAATKQLANGFGGETKSFFTHTIPRAPNLKQKLLGKNTYSRSSGFSSASTQGLQNAINLGRYFDAVDISGMFTSISQTTSAANAAKVLLLSCHATALITNATNDEVHATIYDVMVRQDGGSLNIDPAATFLAGNLDASGGAAADATLPGVTPWNNPRFSAAYKILGATPLVLSSGKTHTHTVNYAPNQVFNKERIVINNSLGPIGQLTCYSFIVHHGTPVHDSTTETLVTLGISKLDIVLLESITWQVMLQNYPSNSITTTLATNLTGEQWMTDGPTDTANAS